MEDGRLEGSQVLLKYFSNGGDFMNTKNEFRYLLRFAIQPGHHEKERFETLVEFCKAAKIDDVTFHLNCEELNQGHLIKEETKEWMELISKAKESLLELNITTSINPWITLLHGDRGRKLKEGQNFRLMVDPYGNKASATVCPECENWQQYITEMYAYYASIKPDIVWLEDDFRFHNHYPLIWGGCFCDKHMEEFSKKAGKKLTREEFVEGILKPGKPHQYRKIWLETCRDTMTKLAEKIGKAVHEISPETKVGLMSSSPMVHCAEGRDWGKLLKGLAGEHSPVDRIHLPAYSTETLQNYLLGFSSSSRMTAAVLPEDTIIYPELENFPHSRFSKSKAFTQFQIETSLAVGAKGITINIFDMMGNGIMISEGYQYVLAESKDFLSKISSLNLNMENEQGIKILFDSKSSFTIETEIGKNMRELYPQETFFASLFSAYGIANTYSKEKVHNGEVIAVSGQYFRNLTKNEIKNIFENNYVIMNGDAAYTLFKMGYGSLAGIKNAEWREEDSAYQAFEQVCDGKVYAGISEARISSQVCAGDFLQIEYDKNPKLKTIIKNPKCETIAYGMTVYDNHVFILPYGKFNNGYEAHLNTLRQEIIKETIREIKGYNLPVFLKDAPYVAIYHYTKENKNYFMLCNCSDDELNEIKIYIGDLKINRLTEINRNSTLGVIVEQYSEDGYITIKSKLLSKEVKLFIE